MTDLYVKKGRRYFPAGVEEVRAVAFDSLDPIRGMAIKSPDDTARFLKLKLAGREAEVFVVITLDNRHRVIECHEMFNGTIDGTAVYPREVAKQALADNAAAVILAHNHPSGIAEPSQADERITHRLRDALNLIDIRVLDHLVIGGGNHVSLMARGCI